MTQDLDQLAGHLQTVDAEIAGASSVGPSADGQAPAPADEPADQAGEFAAVLQMAVATLTPALPFLPNHYTNETCQRIGVAFGAVAEKRGWNLQELMTPEVALAVVTLPPTIGAIAEGRAYFAQLKLQRQQQEQAERERAREAASSGG